MNVEADRELNRRPDAQPSLPSGLDEAAVELKAAHGVPIADAEDKAILDGDLASEPWYGLTL